MGQEKSKISRRGFTKASALMLTGAVSLTGAHAMGDAPVGKKPARIPAEDRLDMIELMARYAWSYDCGHMDGFIQCFTPDGIIEAFGKEEARGHASMKPLLEMLFKIRGDKGWQHLTDHHHFQEFDGVRCKVYSYFLMPEMDKVAKVNSVRSMGYYISYCVKIDDEWYFEKRSIHRWDGVLPFPV